MKDFDWAQKYRPASIKDVILSEQLKKKIERIIEQGGGMSLLFWGRPGCGKTTVAKLINPENTVLINCSTNSTIETVRWIEREFASRTLDGARRVLLLDEADNLSTDAQAALRGVCEAQSKENDFVLTANNLNKLSEALRSRFLPVEFSLDHEDVRVLIEDRLLNIAELEGYKTPEKSLVQQIFKYYPDMRRMIKTLQFEINTQI